MRAGRLNKRVTIQVPAAGRDELGQPVVGWSNFVTTGDGKVWASVMDMSGREYVAAGAVQSATVTKVCVRFREGITASMRVVHGADVYGIEAALRQGPRDLLLMCKRIDA